MLFLGAICIAFAPIFVKAADLAPTAAGIYRCLFGGAAFLLYFLVLRRRSPIITNRTALLWLFLAGSIFAFDLLVWHRSIVFSGAGLATILGNTQVFYLGLIGVLFLKERPSYKYYMGVFLGFIGICLLVGLDDVKAKGEHFFWGVFYGLLTGLIYATYLSTLRHIEKKFPEISTGLRMAYVSLLACLGLTLVAKPMGELEALTGWNWFYMLGLGLVAQFAGWFIITKNLPKVEISKAGLIILTQPVLASILGYALFQEQLSSVQLIGATLTLLGIYLGSLSRSRPRAAQ